KRPFFNFLAQGDSWFDYTCGSAIIDWLQALFKPENAYFKNIAASGRTLRQMLSRDFKDKLAAGPPNGARWSGILLRRWQRHLRRSSLPGLAQAQWRRGASARLLHHPRLRPRARHSSGDL